MALVSYYLCAHQDDWQLFRGEQAAADISLPDTRVIFIYSTAGELNYIERGIAPSDLWPVREAAAMESLRSILKGEITEGVASINGKHVIRKQLANTTSYFLRLPQGTRLLRHRYVNDVRTVDGVNTYTWSELRVTLRALLDSELGNAERPAWVNYSSCDESVNTGSNPDHYDIGVAFEAANEDGAYNQLGWIDYRTENDEDCPPNLTDNQVATKLLLTKDSYFTVIGREFGFDDFSEGNYQRWIAKSYFAAPEGIVSSHK